jgi:hypothetical protein
MGKPVDVEFGDVGGLEIAGGGGGGCAGFCGAIGQAVSFRCVFVLLLAAGVLVPALFLLVPSRHEGYLSDDPDVLAGEIPYLFRIEFQSWLVRAFGGFGGFSWGSPYIGGSLRSRREAGRSDGAAIAASVYQAL